MKGSRVETRTGRDHSPVTVTGKTDGTWGGKTVYHQSNQSRIVRNENRSSNTFPPPLPSSRAQLHSHFSPSSPRAAQGDGEWGCGQFITRCLCRSFLLRGRTPHTLPLLQHEGSSHGRQFFMNCYSAGPSHGLQLCTNVDPSYGVQSFRNRLLQRGSPIVCRGTSAPAPGAPPHFFFTDLGVCGVVSLTQSHSSLSTAVPQQVFPLLKYVILEVLPPSLMGSALGSSGSVLEPAGTGSVRHGGGFSQLLTEATPIAPHYQNLATQTHNRQL